MTEITEIQPVQNTQKTTGMKNMRVRKIYISNKKLYKLNKKY